MKCQKCGAENHESAQFCSLCMEPLQGGGSEAPRRKPDVIPGGSYVAPGEWRGDAEILSPTVSKVVETKVRRFRIRLAVYGLVVLLIAAWLVLSFTVWGNPSPGRVSSRLIEAINARDPDAFVELFKEKDRAVAEDLYARITSYIGSSGRYENIKLDVDKPNNYDAYSYIDSGNIAAGAGGSISISRSDNLMITLYNQGGRWYVVSKGTDLIP